MPWDGAESRGGGVSKEEGWRKNEILCLVVHARGVYKCCSPVRERKTIKFILTNFHQRAYSTSYDILSILSYAFPGESEITIATLDPLSDSRLLCIFVHRYSLESVRVRC